VQDAMKSTDYGKSMKYLFQPDTKEETKKEQHNTKSNVHGLLLYHPVLLNSPWEAPDDLDEQISKMNGLNPIVFKNPEKLNGKVEMRGKAYEVTFIGRNLSVKENNWTWVLTETEANIEHTLSVLKYPKTDGYATIVTNSYGQIKTIEVLRNNLDDKQFILNKLLSLTELPF
jgi:hypothetical protein